MGERCTTNGTFLLKDINPGALNGSPSNLTNLNGTLYFAADNGTGPELYKSDGTSTGTVLVADLNSKPGIGSSPQSMVLMGGFIYFTANSDTTGRELFKLNPAGGTPTVVKDINLGIASANVSDLTVIGTTIYFTADPGTRVRELWKTRWEALPEQFAFLICRRECFVTLKSDCVWQHALLQCPHAANQIDLWFTNGTAAGTKPHAEAGLLKRVLQVSVLNDEGDDRATGADATAAATSSLSIDLSTVSATDLIRVDLTTLIRNVIAAGKTRVTLRLQFTTTSSDLLSVFVPDAAHQSGLNVTTAREEGVLGDLYDSAGSLLARGKSI